MAICSAMPPQGKAEEVALFVSKVFDQGCGVIRHQFKAKWTLDVGGMPLQFNIDDAPRCGTGSPIALMVMKPPGSSTSGCPLPCILYTGRKDRKLYDFSLRFQEFWSSEAAAS